MKNEVNEPASAANNEDHDTRMNFLMEEAISVIMRLTDEQLIELFRIINQKEAV